MQKFIEITGIAAPLAIDNIDTDMIIPKQFLKTIKRTGLGANLFDEMRFDKQGSEIADFILNKPAYRNSQILVSGDNFGCGSSREHAPWAIVDFGIRCIIATSFADIFYNNCFKNSILPIKLEQDKVNVLMQEAQKEGNSFHIDLPNQVISVTGSDIKIAFELDPFRKKCLLEGLDDIGQTLQKAECINDYENKMKAKTPWLWQGSAA